MYTHLGEESLRHHRGLFQPTPSGSPLLQTLKHNTLGYAELRVLGEVITEHGHERLLHGLGGPSGHTASGLLRAQSRPRQAP